MAPTPPAPPTPPEGPGPGWDLLIRGATVIDGSGAPARVADVAVSAGRIAAVGALSGPAREVIDAAGLHLLPGFIDLHTHYDGQATWDPELAPSAWHGVTTAVMGNCGVGFAPVRPGDEARLISLMEGVEDIPGAALAEGIPWGWESFGEYLDALDRLPRAFDICAQVPHDALRVYVMGERARAGEPATEEDRTQMAALLSEALAQGALGFSTGRSGNHKSADGADTPAAEADALELEALARAVGGSPHGLLQIVSDFDLDRGPAAFDPEFELVERVAAAGGGHPVSLSLIQRVNAPEQWRRVLARAEAAAARGLPLRLQVSPRPIGVLLGFEATFHPFLGHPTWQALAHLPVAEQAAALRQPELRARLLSEAPRKVSGTGSPLPPLADALLARIDEASLLMFPVGDTPDYEPPVTDSLGARALQEGRRPLEVLLDAMLADEGRGLVYFALFNYLGLNLDVVREMMAHPLSLAGLSDGGAHVGTVCDASFPTTLLAWWGRDRPEGRFALPWLVRRLSGQPAAFAGLTDRGQIAPGLRADLNLVDLGALAVERPHLVHDLPAGGRRFVQGARGYVGTWVAGQRVMADGRSTGARPGRVVRRFGPPSAQA
jgi:N-acyl-D-aspartate/D-glutamate deacylase